MSFCSCCGVERRRVTPVIACAFVRVPPVQPRPVTVACGLALTVFSLWLLFGFLPGAAWHASPWAYVVAAALGILGVASAIEGATYRPPAPRRGW